MKRKDLQHLKLDSSLFKKATSSTDFQLIEGVSIQNKYSKEDIESIEHLHFAAGFAPYLRGIQSTMYVTQPWLINQYPSCSTIAEYNAYYRKNIAKGSKTIPIALGSDTSQHKDTTGRFLTLNGSNIYINDIEDMKGVFDQIPLDTVAINMTIHHDVLPVLALYIAAALEQEINLKMLTGSIQYDFLSPHITESATYSTASQLLTDILCYTQEHLPNLNAISISNASLKKKKLPVDIELAYSLAQGIDYIRIGQSKGITTDRLASRLSYFWVMDINHFTEIAKMRAARILWAKIVKTFHPKNDQSLALNIQAQTSNGEKIKGESIDYITRTTIEATAAVFGGMQTLQIPTTNEPTSFPNTSASRLARNTQIILQEETKLCKTVDPWAGSYYIERLTEEITTKTWAHLQEIENLGGLGKAIKTGLLQKQVEAAATGQNTTLDELQTKFNQEEQMSTSIQQVENDSQLKRDTTKVKEALDQLTLAVQTGKDNVLALAIEAAKARATIQELTQALVN